MSDEPEVTQDLPEGETVAETPAIIEAPATGTEQTPEVPEITGSEAEKPKQEPWFQKRINTVTREKYEAERRAQAAEQALAELRSGKPEQTDAPTAPADVDRLVNERAQEIVRTTQFNDKCNEVYSSGKAEFSDFDDTLGNFRMLGGLPQPLLEAVTQLPDAHKVLYALGQNMDEAERIVSLPPVPMALALAKLSMSQPKAKPVSNAPPPIRPIDGAPKGQLDPDDMSTDEWIKWREGELKRSA
jgi:hypothetical protein